LLQSHDSFAMVDDPRISLSRADGRECETGQVDGLSPYTANLCPLSFGFEFAGFSEDFGEPIGKVFEAVLGSGV